MKFSIVTAAYNASATIADTIASVGTQSWTDYEHLIIDGASSDSTQSVVDRMRHGRLAFISEPDRGCYDAMNKGLARATGDVVVFLNADDFLAHSEVLRRVAETFRSTGAQCVAGQTVVVDQRDVRRVRRVYSARSFRPWMLRFGHMPPHPSFYARRDILVEAGGFDLRFRISADFDLMVRLFLNRQITWTALTDSLAIFRDGGISTRNLAAKRQINREISASLRGRGVGSAAPLLWTRYPFKAMQLLARPSDYPGQL